MSKGVFSVLKDKSFSSLVVTQFLGAFNDNLFKQLLVLFMFATAASSTDGKLYNSIAGLLFPLPFILFSIHAGVAADRYSKRTIIVIAKWMEVGVMLSAMLAFYLQERNFLFLTLFFMGTQSALFGPSKYGVLPELLPKKDLSRGNGVILLTTFMAIIVGTGAAGVLKEGFGSTSFKESSFHNSKELVWKVKAQEDPVSLHLISKFPAVTKEMIEKADKASEKLPENWKANLIDGLNAVVNNDKVIYSSEIFAEVKLSSATKKMIANKEIEGRGIPHTNRLLLEDAYPKEIKKSQQLHWACLLFVLIAALGTLTSYGVKKLPPSSPETDFINPISGFMSNWKMLGETSLLRAGVLSNTYLWFLGTVIMLGINDYGIILLKLSDIETSYTLALLSLGIALGSVCAAKLSGDSINFKLIPQGSFFVVGALIAVFFLPYAIDALDVQDNTKAKTILLGGILFFAGVVFALAVVPVQAFLQEAAPEDKKGRVLSMNNLCNFTGMFFSSAFYWFTAVFCGMDANETMGVLAIMTLIFGLVARNIFRSKF